MTRKFSVPFATVLVAAAVLPASATASCIRMSPAEQRARADVIFDGVALEGPTSTGVQRFRVSRFLKGTGPAVIRVNTGNIRRPDGSGAVTSVSIIVKRGERWRIVGRGSVRIVLRTSSCDGSRRRG